LALVVVTTALFAVSFSACTRHPASPGAGDEGAGRPAAAAEATPSPLEKAPPEPVTFTVLAGDTSSGFVDVQAFVPETLDIRVGDTVVWKVVGHEGHGITFDPNQKYDEVGSYMVPDPKNPSVFMFSPYISKPVKPSQEFDGTQLINSGFLGIPVPQEFSLTFTREGVFEYICLVHPFNMRGRIIVHQAGSEVPSPAVVEARAKEEMARYVEEGRQRAQSQRVEAFAKPDGTWLWLVHAGLDTEHTEIVQFLPAALNIKVGDTVTWLNSQRDFHTATFHGAEPPPYFVVFRMDGDTPLFILNPRGSDEFPPPAAGFGPQTFVSSGIMGPFFNRQTYTLTFTEPGRYLYVCTVHLLAGMSGIINVEPR